MADDDGQQNEDPKDLRAKLSAANTEREKAIKELHVFKVRDILTEKNLHLVKPEDLKDVDLKDVESAATTLQTQRVEAETAVARKLAKAMGLSDEQVESAVQAMSAGNEVRNEAAEATARARQLSQKGNPLPVTTQIDELHGFAAIKAGMKTS